MVILCYLMLVCQELFRRFASICLCALLGTNTARPWQIALRATAVWWSFISPATTSVIAELRRLCLGLGGMSDGFGSWTLLELWQRVIFKGLGVKFD